MGAFYCDSSALVKRYAHGNRDSVGQEPDNIPSRPRHFHRPYYGHRGSGRDCSEDPSARDCRARRHDGHRTFKGHFTTQYQIVLMTTGLVDRAMELAEKHGLRGYDATTGECISRPC